MRSQRLEQAVDCLPMMSERTMILVYDYDLFKASAGDKEAFTALFADLPDYVCLVFICDLIEYKPDARTKLAAAIKQHGSTVKFTRQEQGDLVDWIRRRFRALDHDIDSELARYLIFLCGDLMTGLISEIGKIGAYARHRVITREDIDAVATPQLDAVVFQLTDAITGGNFDKAASVMGDLLHMGEPPIKILSVLGRQLRQLYSARLALEGRKGTGYLVELVGSALGLSGPKADRRRPAVRPGLVPYGGIRGRPGRSCHEIRGGGGWGGASDRAAAEACEHTAKGGGQTDPAGRALPAHPIIRKAGGEAIAPHPGGHRGRGPL
ncbi:MAG: DNA polymerase III subunit delta [Intestinimonas sp.]